MRACEPVQTGVVVREGVRIAYSVYGNGEPSVLLLPAWSIVHSRMWKAQIPYLARHARVVTFDGRGNGLSDKSSALNYSDEAFAADALAVLDATGTARATLVGLSAGARWAVLVAARYPDRVERLICIGPAVPTAPRDPDFVAALSAFDRVLDSDEGWWKFNRHYWEAHYREFLKFFFREALPEPHSSKPFEDCVGWGLETTPETLAATAVARQVSAREFRELLEAVRCPVSVIHGEDDRIVPAAAGRALADATQGRFVLLPGSGHLPQARHPVRINVKFVMPSNRVARRTSAHAGASASSSSHRPSVSGTRSGTLRSRRSFASFVPMSTSSGLPSIPLPKCCRRAGKRFTRRAPRSSTNPPTSRVNAPNTTYTRLPPFGIWMKSSSIISWFSTT